MQSHGVGAPPNEITVLPLRSAHRKLGSRLAAQEEEPVAIVDRGEVHERRLASVGLIEAPHETRERHVRLAARHHADRSGAELRGRHVDFEPLGGEMAPVDGDRERSIEDRAERLGDSNPVGSAHVVGV